MIVLPHCAPPASASSESCNGWPVAEPSMRSIVRNRGQQHLPGPQRNSARIGLSRWEPSRPREKLLKGVALHAIDRRGLVALELLHQPVPALCSLRPLMRSRIFPYSYAATGSALISS